MLWDLPAHVHPVTPTIRNIRNIGNVRNIANIYSAPCTCWPSNQVNDIYPVIVLSYRLYLTSCIQPYSYLYIALLVTTLFSALHPAYTNSITLVVIVTNNFMGLIFFRVGYKDLGIYFGDKPSP